MNILISNAYPVTTMAETFAEYNEEKGFQLQYCNPTCILILLCRVRICDALLFYKKLHIPMSLNALNVSQYSSCVEITQASLAADFQLPS